METSKGEVIARRVVSSSSKASLKVSLSFMKEKESGGGEGFEDESHPFYSARMQFETPDQEKAYLFQAFTTFDENNDGRITADEMHRSLAKLGISLPLSDLQSAIDSVVHSTDNPVGDSGNDSVDNSVDGSIGFHGFCELYRSLSTETHSATATATSEEEDAELRSAFQVFDQDGNGFITATELKSVLHSLGLQEGKSLAKCEQLIAGVDSDKDGRVSFGEFQNMMDTLKN